MATRSTAASCSAINGSSAITDILPAAIIASLCRMPATRFRSAAVALTAAEAGLFSSWVSPADSEPSASNRSRWPITSLEFLIP